MAGRMPADPRIVPAPAVADPARNDAARRGRLRAKRLRANRYPLRRMPADGWPARSHVPFRVAGGGCRRPAAGPRVRASGMQNAPSGSVRPGPPDGGAAAAPWPAPHASPAPLFRHRHAVMPQERVRAPAAAAPVWQSAFVRDPACRTPGSRIAAKRAASAVLLPAHLRQPQARPHLPFVARGQRSLFIRRAASGLRPPGDARPGGPMRRRAGSRRFRRSAPGRGVCSGRLWRSRARCRAAERVARKDTGGARRARPRVLAGTAPGRRAIPSQYYSKVNWKPIWAGTGRPRRPVLIAGDRLRPARIRRGGTGVPRPARAAAGRPSGRPRGPFRRAAVAAPARPAPPGIPRGDARPAKAPAVPSPPGARRRPRRGSRAEAPGIRDPGATCRTNGPRRAAGVQ